MVAIAHAFLLLMSILTLPSETASAASSTSAVGRQTAIEGAASGETIIGLSSVDGDYLMLGVSQSHKLKVRNGGPILMSVGHEELVMGLVGLPAGRQVTIDLAQNFVLQYFSDNNENIPVGMLAMKMADEVYKRSKSTLSAPLMFNAALLGRSLSNSKHHKSEIKLIKVDQSAGFFDCKAVALGFKAAALNAWLKEKYGESSPEDLTALMKRGMECVQELDMKGEINVEICLMTARPNIRTHGPLALSHTTMNKLNTTQFDSLLKDAMTHT